LIDDDDIDNAESTLISRLAFTIKNQSLKYTSLNSRYN